MTIETKRRVAKGLQLGLVVGVLVGLSGLIQTAWLADPIPALAQTVTVDSTQSPIVVNAVADLADLTPSDGQSVIIKTGAEKGLWYYDKDSATATSVSVLNGPGSVGRFLVINNDAGSVAAATAITAAEITDDGLLELQAFDGSTAKSLTLEELKKTGVQVVNVLQYGADSTGVADSTTAVENAVAAMPASGGVLYFPTGTYDVDNGVTFDTLSDFIVLGDKATLTLPSTHTTSPQYCFDIDTCTNFRVSGIAFSRSQSTTTAEDHSGILIRSCQGGVVDNCDFSDCNLGVAIWAEAADTTDIVVRNCTATGSLSYTAGNDSNQLLQGELVYMQDGTTFHCKDITVDQCTGIKVNMLVLAEAGTDRVTVTNCKARETHDSSIYLRANGLTVSGCQVYHAGKDAIKALLGATSADPHRVAITNNSILGAGINKSDGGVMINVDATNCVVSGNVLEMTTASIASATQKGIFASNSATNVVGNSIKGTASTSYGIMVRTDLGDISGVVIRDNLLDFTGGYGILASYTSTRYIRNLVIDGNLIKGAADAIYINDGASGTQIEDLIVERNVFTGVTTNGINLRGVVRPIVRDNRMTSFTGGAMFRFGYLVNAIFEGNQCDSSTTFRNASTGNITYRRRSRNYRDAADQDAFVAFTADDATPSVDGLASGKTANANPTTVTALDDGYAGQSFVLLINDANTTIDFTGTTLKGNNGVDWSPASGDHMVCTNNGTNWYCVVSEN